MNYGPGDEVICLKTSKDGLAQKGKFYTVDEVFKKGDIDPLDDLEWNKDMITLKGIHRRPGPDWPFEALRAGFKAKYFIKIDPEIAEAVISKYKVKEKAS